MVEISTVSCIVSCILWEKETMGIGSTFGYLDDKALHLYMFRLDCLHYFIYIDFSGFPPFVLFFSV